MIDGDRDTGYKLLLGGCQFDKNFALEGGHFDSGKFGFTATTVPAGRLSGNIGLNGLNLDAIGIVFITEKFSAFGRFGLTYAEARDFFTGTGLVKMPSAWDRIETRVLRAILVVAPDGATLGACRT